MAQPAPTHQAHSTEAVLYRVARRVLVARDFSAIVRSVLAGAAQLIPAWRHSLGLVDDVEGTFTVFRAAGDGERHFQAGTTIPLSRFGGNMDLLRAGQLDVVQDLERASPSSRGELSGTALCGQLLAPILLDGMLVATLNVGADRPGHFTKPHLDAASRLAELIGSALRQHRFQQELQEAHQLAMAASRAKGAFLANMSHELRTPLNAIIGYAELLTEESDDIGASCLHPDLERIRGSARHLLALIDDVLDLAKVEAGKLEFQYTDVDLGPLLQDVASAARPLVARRNNRWELDADADATFVRADPTRLRQILYNLVANAAKFTRDGTVGLRVRAIPGRVQFAVHDTGIGIPNDKLPVLFDAFTQAHVREAEDFGGTGLGLSISKRYAESMGGKIEVVSAVGRGTTFTLTMPIA